MRKIYIYSLLFLSGTGALQGMGAEKINSSTQQETDPFWCHIMLGDNIIKKV